MKFVYHGDLSKLQAVRESVLQINAPLSLVLIMFCQSLSTVLWLLVGYGTLWMMLLYESVIDTYFKIQIID